LKVTTKEVTQKIFTYNKKELLKTLNKIPFIDEYEEDLTIQYLQGGIFLKIKIPHYKNEKERFVQITYMEKIIGAIKSLNLDKYFLIHFFAKNYWINIQLFLNPDFDSIEETRY